MKKTIITCDHCDKTIIGSEYIELGSDTDKLRYNNKMKTKEGELISLCCGQLQFCSKDHFVDYFFNKTHHE